MWPQTFLGFIPRRGRNKRIRTGNSCLSCSFECSQLMSMSDCWETCLCYQVLRETEETLFQWKSELNRSWVFAGDSPKPAAELALLLISFKRQSPANNLCLLFSLKGTNIVLLLDKSAQLPQFPQFFFSSAKPISLYWVFDRWLLGRGWPWSSVYGPSANFHSKSRTQGPQ